MEDLTIEIPKRYKKSLMERFNPKNAKISVSEGRFEIEKKCPLCNYYRKSIIRNTPKSCGKCPFTKFRKDAGCLLWIDNVLEPGHTRSFGTGRIDSIWWYKENDKEARKELKLLKEKATKLIKWV